MSPNLSLRPFDLVAQLFQLPRLRPEAGASTTEFGRAAMRSASAARRSGTSLPSPAMPAALSHAPTDVAVELRTRLVREYRERVELVRTTLAALDDGWAREARLEAADLDHRLAVWEAYVGDVRAASEPASDLHALGDGVLALVATTIAHLARTPGGWSASDGAPARGGVPGT